MGCVIFHKAIAGAVLTFALLCFSTCSRREQFLEKGRNLCLRCTMKHLLTFELFLNLFSCCIALVSGTEV